MKKKNTLNRRDWIMAGFRALTAEGPQGIRVESIARALKVSKGSFYWHFKDVAALKREMLGEWTALGTFSIIDAVVEKEASARAQLFALIGISVQRDSNEYGGMMAEAAIRDWARYDKLAAKALKEVEATRIKFVADLFEGAGFAPGPSRSKANILYAGLIGLELLDYWQHAKLEKDLFLLLELLLQPGGGGG